MEFPTKSYHDSKEFIRNNIEIPTFERYIKPHLRGENILDIGCGRYSNLFVEWGAKSVIGIDNNEEMIKNCFDKYQDNPSLKFSKVPYQDLDFKNEFGVITSIHSLYFDNSAESLNQTFFKISKALKQGGLFFAYLTNGSAIASLSEEEERKRIQKSGMFFKI
uniref:Methyltransferase domain-containing protein n=1 Tax=Acrobeloides nanus TaxID=290746 RepID=A0A914CV03_9BILA